MPRRRSTGRRTRSNYRRSSGTRRYSTRGVQRRRSSSRRSGGTVRLVIEQAPAGLGTAPIGAGSALVGGTMMQARPVRTKPTL